MRHMNTVHRTVENIKQLSADIPARKSLIIEKDECSSKQFRDDEVIIIEPSKFSPMQNTEITLPDLSTQKDIETKNKFSNCSTPRKTEVLNSCLEKLDGVQLDAVFGFIVDSVWAQQ